MTNPLLEILYFSKKANHHKISKMRVRRLPLKLFKKRNRKKISILPVKGPSLKVFEKRRTKVPTVGVGSI